MPGALFQQRIRSVSQISRDKWGDRTNTVLYQNVACRFTYDTARVREAMAEDEKVDAVAYIHAKYTIKPDYIFTFEGEDYIVIKVFKETDIFGNTHHQKIALRSR